MIKVIHQTWKNDSPPPDIFRPDWVESWISRNPGWGYQLWTDEDISRFVSDHYPEFFPVWCSYPKQIMRVDAWRYLLLKRQGGLYVDLDIAALRPLEPWIDQFEKFSCADQGDQHLCNALMWAPEAELPFLQNIVAAMTECAYHWDPLDATGPKFLQRYASSRMHMVSQIPTDAVFPITVWNRRPMPLARAATLDVLAEYYAGAIAISFWTGSWTQQPDTLVAPSGSAATGSCLGLADLHIAVVSSSEREELRHASEAYYKSIPEVSVTHWRAGAGVESYGAEPREREPVREIDLTAILRGFLASSRSWIFVCSERTYVVPGRLGSLIEDGMEFVSNESLLVRKIPGRDAGYMMSKGLAQAVVDSGNVRDESDLAAFLSEHHVPVKITPLLRHDRSRYPAHSNQIVSTAFNDYRYFAVVPKLLNTENVTAIRCAHQGWKGDLEFVEDGGCVRPATGCCGFWQPLGNGHRGIDWFDWPQEIMLHVEDGLGFVILAEHADSIFL